MNGTNIFVDTNICIYLLNGDEVIGDMLNNRNLFISIITEMELCTFQGYSAIEIIKTFLDSITIINIDEGIKESAIKIRTESKLKLPDSIIAASAITNDMPLITADKDFKKIIGLDLILFEHN